LHLARICASFIVEKSTLTVEDLATINPDLITIEKLKECADFIVEIIDEYKTEHPEANLINMAKTKSFTDALLSKLNNKF
jgi:hypothetical protein